MSNDNIIYVDTDGRTLDNVVKLDTTYWTEEDFCALDGLTNEQTWEFAWSDTGCTTPAQFAAKIAGTPLATYKVYHSRIVTDVYEVQAQDESDAELLWLEDPQGYKIVETTTDNDLVEVAR